MKTRTLNQLYVLLYEEVKNDKSFYICNEIEILLMRKLISEEEYYILREHFKSQRPTKKLHIEFYNHKSYNKDLKGSISWWSSFVLGKLEQRLLFIQKLIEITK